MLRYVGALALATVFSGVALAQGKIGIINLQRTVLDTAEWKKAQGELQAKFKPRTDALQKAQQELSDIQTQLQASPGQLSPQGEAELQARGTRKQREAERLNEDLQADAERERNVVIERVQSRLDAILKKIADEQSLDVIIDTTNRVWHKPALEITDAVIAAYDKAYPAK